MKRIFIFSLSTSRGKPSCATQSHQYVACSKRHMHALNYSYLHWQLSSTFVSELCNWQGCEGNRLCGKKGKCASLGRVPLLLSGIYQARSNKHGNTSRVIIQMLTNAGIFFSRWVLDQITVERFCAEVCTKPFNSYSRSLFYKGGSNLCLPLPSPPSPIAVSANKRMIP